MQGVSKIEVRTQRCDTYAGATLGSGPSLRAANYGATMAYLAFDPIRPPQSLIVYSAAHAAHA
jgi:hypothetical protein